MRLISKQVLRQYMQYRGFRSTSELAKRVGCSKATITHLHGGGRKTCSPDMARRIEEALQAPPGSLFVAEVSTFHVGSGHRAA